MEEGKQTKRLLEIEDADSFPSRTPQCCFCFFLIASDILRIAVKQSLTQEKKVL